MKYKKAMLIIVSIFVTFTVNANNVQQEIDLLKKQLNEIQARLLQLEKQNQQQNNTTEQSIVVKKTTPLPTKGTTSAKKNKDIKLYASLRPTFGHINEDDNKVWDVRDALSNAGFKSTYKFKDGWQATLHGEWGIDLSNNADFGKARQVYVALDSPLGRFGIGKQRPVQYLFIAEYIDIFNHSRSPFAYDPESPFFVNNLFTYQKKISDFTWMLASQFNGDEGNDNSDFFNAGVSYDKNNLHLALTYSTKDIYQSQDMNVGEDKVYAGSVAYTFNNNLYLAIGYQDIDYQRRYLKDRNGHTFDISLAYPIGNQFKVKTGYFDFEDGFSSVNTQDYNGANLTFEWLPADNLRFHLEYLRRDFEQLPDFNSLSVGFRYDYAQSWKF